MRGSLHFIFYLFFAGIAQGQVTLITAVKDREYRVGEQVTVNFVLRIEGQDLVQESPLYLPDFSKFQVVGNASERNAFIDPAKKIAVNQVVYQWVISPKNPGRQRIGSAMVDVSGVRYKTEPIDILVRENMAPEKPARQEGGQVHLAMHLNSKNTFENQPVVATVRAYSTDYNKLRNVGKVHWQAQSGVTVTPVSLEKAEIEQDEESKMASQVIAVLTIIPDKLGEIELNPVMAEYRTEQKPVKLFTNKQKLVVKTLPGKAPKTFDQIVGRYKMSLTGKNVRKKVPLNKPIDIYLKVSGEGNLSVDKLPGLLESDDYTFYKPKISTELIDTEMGKSGVYTAHYIVVPKKSGMLSIGTEGLTFFNPKRGEYKEISGKTLIVEVQEEAVGSNTAVMQRVNDYSNSVLQTVETPVLGTRKLIIDRDEGISWSTVLGNFGIFAVAAGALGAGFYYFRKSRAKVPQGEDSALSLAETERLLRDQQAPDISADLEYLSKLIREGKIEEFFKTFYTMDFEVNEFLVRKYRQNTAQYLEDKYGYALAQRYAQLISRVKIEKYSPMREADAPAYLLEEAKDIFSQIK